MEQKIIKYYIEGLSNHRLITKKIKVWLLGYVMLTVLWAFSSIIALDIIISIFFRSCRLFYN